MPRAVKDGGIDGEVSNAEVPSGQGLIKPGLTRYQIKTGSFSPQRAREILFSSGDQLKPRIRSCLDKHGTLVVVLFGWDNPDSTDDTSVNQRFLDLLVAVDSNYRTAKIEVWRQNNIISFISNFPSLALQIVGRGNDSFQSHTSWSRDAEMSHPLKLGAAQSETIDAIRQELRKTGSAIHVRLYGEAGIGKTRIALEATAPNDLAPLVLYCQASEFRDSRLMYEMLRDGNSYKAIIVLDECDADSRSYIWNKFKFRGDRLKFVSIYNEWDSATGSTTYLSAPPVEDEKIKAIIQTYVPLADYTDKWVAFCGGYPRVSHVIGSNLKNNPEDLLRPPDTVELWSRFVVGGDDAYSSNVEQRQIVLCHLALFKRFGFSGPVAEEGKAIADAIRQVDRNITYSRFKGIVSELRSRRILQGEYTLYISPKLLHIWLWTEWWRRYGTPFDLESFSQMFPPVLVEGFQEMFRYAAESEAATVVVRKLLGPSGPFTDDYIKTESGSHFFLALTQVSPALAMACLRRTVGTWSKEELLHFIERRDVVFALEHIVEWKDLFVEGAQLLLALAEAENESWGNNASGVFTSLFSPARGEVAPTELPPVERFPILKEALASDSSRRRQLAIKALDTALETHHFYRTIGSHRERFTKPPERWTPKTWGELFDTYRAAWSILVEAIETLPVSEKGNAIAIVLNRSRGLLEIHNVAPMVIGTLGRLPENSYVEKKKVLASLISTLHYSGKNLSTETLSALKDLRDRLVGTDFSSLLKRYVGMNLLTDRVDVDGNHVNSVDVQIEKLAAQAVERPSLLVPELSWLVTEEAEHGFQFGFQLAQLDGTFSLLPGLLDAQQRAGMDGNPYLLGGYLRSLRDRDAELWEDTLTKLAEDIQMRRFVVDLTWRSANMTEASAHRILSLAQEGVVESAEFAVFGYGGVIQSLTEKVFVAWAKYLLAQRDRVAGSVLLDLFCAYYVYKSDKRLPVSLTIRTLTNPVLLRPTEKLSQ